MRSLRYIVIAIAVALSFVACSKTEMAANENDWPIFRGYMQFSTEVNSGISTSTTRADLAESMRGREFGVLGYQYATTTNWSTAKPLAKPDVFYNQQVMCDANGVSTYDTDSATDGNQLKPWEDYLYSFFAYQPHNGAGITLSGSGAVNTPTLTYTYGWLGNVAGSKTNPIAAYNNENIYDLMTAEAIDVNARTGSVGLEFKHRLFAIEVLANNFNENDVDSLGNAINARQTITNLKLKISGLKHRAMTIPLSMQDGEAAPTYTGDAVDTVTFQISNKAVVVPAFNESITDNGETRGGGVASSISRLGSENSDGYLMFIPQNAEISFEFDWKELADIIENNTNKADIQTSFQSSMDFQAGLLYQVIINFVGNGITIAIIEAGSWEQQTVYHTFE